MRASPLSGHLGPAFPISTANHLASEGGLVSHLARSALLHSVSSLCLLASPMQYLGCGCLAFLHLLLWVRNAVLFPPLPCVQRFVWAQSYVCTDVPSSVAAVRCIRARKLQASTSATCRFLRVRSRLSFIPRLARIAFQERLRQGRLILLFVRSHGADDERSR